MESFCAGRTEAPGLALRQASGHSVPLTGWAGLCIGRWLCPGFWSLETQGESGHPSGNVGSFHGKGQPWVLSSVCGCLACTFVRLLSLPHR